MGGNRRLLKILEWLDLDTLKVLSQHGGNVVFCLLISALIRVAIVYTTGPDFFYQDTLLRLDHIANIGFVIWLLREVSVILWNKREKLVRGLHVFVVA